MARTPNQVRPYWEVRHEYDASLKEYLAKLTMLHSAVRTVIQLGTTPEKAMRCIEMLKEHEAAAQEAGYGRG